MNDIAVERPSFFEGEVLGASDLQQLIVYLRDREARHQLGAHTWGIVAGLQLVEQASATGGVDMYLLPGYATDGYGRGILVISPIQLSTDQFSGQATGQVQVWIRYDEGQTSATKPGFQVCCGDGDAYSRVAESYAIEVGNFSLANQQSGVVIAGDTVDDARTAPRTFDDDGPLICDASVAYQNLPTDDAKARWLVPLGQVGWQNGTPGQFTTLLDAAHASALVYARRLRRYAGVVAQDVFAADGLIRLRARTHQIAGLVDQHAVDVACALDDAAGPTYDAAFASCGGLPTPNELVWIEGKLRVNGDTRVLGGRLELRDVSGIEYYPPTAVGAAPTLLQRNGDAAGPNADLAVVIGKAAAGSHNRFQIQVADPPAAAAQPCQRMEFTTAPVVTVQDTGEVGIGTDKPDQMLAVVGKAQTFVHVTDAGSTAQLFVGAGDFGGIISAGNGDLRFRVGDVDPTDDTDTAMTIAATGAVGIGTSDPDNSSQLTLEDKSSAQLMLRTTDQKHVGVLRTSKKGTVLFADVAKDDLILSADGDPDGMVWIKANGNVGINTSDPKHKLGVEDGSAANLALYRTGGVRLVAAADSSGAWLGTDTAHDLKIRTDDKVRATITADGLVGIGTESPNHMLDVRGEIALGTNGQFRAIGGYDNAKIVSGYCDGSGSTSGSNWTASHHTLFDNYYTVSFNDNFASVPVVTVTLAGDYPTTVPMVTARSTDGFTVKFAGVGGQEIAFCFMAMGTR